MYGIDNLVDFSVDAIQVGQDVDKQLADGFQVLTDVPVIVFNNFGKIQDLANKAKLIGDELTDLTPEEIEQFEQRVAARTNLPATGIIGKVRRSLRAIARGYRIGQEIADLYVDVRDIFQKEAA